MPSASLYDTFAEISMFALQTTSTPISILLVESRICSISRQQVKGTRANSTKIAARKNNSHN